MADIDWGVLPLAAEPSSYLVEEKIKELNKDLFDASIDGFMLVHPKVQDIMTNLEELRIYQRTGVIPRK